MGFWNGFLNGCNPFDFLWPTGRDWTSTLEHPDNSIAGDWRAVGDDMWAGLVHFEDENSSVK